MSTPSWMDVAASLEREINAVMEQAWPHDWNEDFLTRSLLRQIHGHLRSRPYLYGSEPVRVSMECYKLTGKHETAFGDIGLLVTVAHKGAKPITGAAYLEAKRRKERTTQFPEIRWPQVKRILKHAPKASLLLYDYEHSTQFVGTYGYVPWGYQVPPPSAPVEFHPVTKVRAVALDTALATQAKDTQLYLYGVPLSIQLVGRYFCGLDLDFSERCVKSLAGFGGKFRTRRLVVVRVIEGHEDAPSPAVNPSVYTREEE